MLLIPEKGVKDTIIVEMPTYSEVLEAEEPVQAVVDPVVEAVDTTVEAVETDGTVRPGVPVEVAGPTMLVQIL
jgi:hypothetical protein